MAHICDHMDSPYLFGAAPRVRVNRESILEANCGVLLSYEQQPLKMLNPRITIILNANQSECITVLIPLPDESYNVRDYIFTQARNKSRVKELNIGG